MKPTNADLLGRFAQGSWLHSHSYQASSAHAVRSLNVRLRQHAQQMEKIVDDFHRSLGKMPGEGISRSDRAVGKLGQATETGPVRGDNCKMMRIVRRITGKRPFQECREEKDAAKETPPSEVAAAPCTPPDVATPRSRSRSPKPGRLHRSSQAGQARPQLRRASGLSLARRPSGIRRSLAHRASFLHRVYSCIFRLPRQAEGGARRAHLQQACDGLRIPEVDFIRQVHGEDHQAGTPVSTVAAPPCTPGCEAPRAAAWRSIAVGGCSCDLGQHTGWQTRRTATHAADLQTAQPSSFQSCRSADGCARRWPYQDRGMSGGRRMGFDQLGAVTIALCPARAAFFTKTPGESTSGFACEETSGLCCPDPWGLYPQCCSKGMPPLQLALLADNESQAGKNHEEEVEQENKSLLARLHEDERVIWFLVGLLLLLLLRMVMTCSQPKDIVVTEYAGEDDYAGIEAGQR
eukprot:s1410_g11.t1